MKKKVVRIVLAVLLLTAAVSVWMVVEREGFDGSRINNPDRFELVFSRMHKTDTVVMPLEKGDTLRIRFEIGKGSADLSVTAGDGTKIYRGDDIRTGDFTAEVPVTGICTVTVQARHAAGSILVEKTGEKTK